ncbi:MAG: response regulator transcription factor [Bacteroidetes bacterium]|nr:response regulator transcription factor [Bacteroidota bacterium]
MKAVIIEDERPSARKLQKILSDFPNIEIVANLESVEESIAYLSNNPHPNIIFSDIVLGDGMSFDIFDQCPVDSFIIFTTAYDDFTLRAFKLNSIDYLLKPIAAKDIELAIEKYNKLKPTTNNHNLLDFKSMLKDPEPKLNRIITKIGHQLKIINMDEVSCLYSENKIVYAQTLERSYPTDFSLEELENILDRKTFFRVNRQVIIQLSFISNITTSPYYKVVMKKQPDTEITVSRERVKDFKDWLLG